MLVYQRVWHPSSDKALFSPLASFPALQDTMDVFISGGFMALNQMIWPLPLQDPTWTINIPRNHALGGDLHLQVGGLEHEFYDFPYIGNKHPNWRTPSFFRGVGIPPTSIFFGTIKLGCLKKGDGIAELRKIWAIHSNTIPFLRAW